MLADALPSGADLFAFAKDYGPIALLLLLYGVAALRQAAQAQRAAEAQSGRLLDGLLGGIGEVRAEVRGLRSDLAQQGAEHGATIQAHGEQLADHGRRLEALERLPRDAGSARRV